MELKFLLFLMLASYPILIFVLLYFASRIYHIENALYDIEDARKRLIKDIEAYRDKVWKLDLGLHQLEERTRK